MKDFMRIILDNNFSEVDIEDVSPFKPIFSKKDGKICGMVVKEKNKGWILRIGGAASATGHYPTLAECLLSCSNLRYEFFGKKSPK